MSKYVIKYSFDKKDNRFVGVCPELFGFIVYADTEEQLKKSCVKVLRIHKMNPDISGKDINFVDIRKIKTETLEM